MTFDFVPGSHFFDTCIELLLLNLAEHDPFMKQLDSIRQDYSNTIADYSWLQIAHLQSIQNPLAHQQQECQQAKAYYGRLLEIVTEYGLNPDWAMERIDYGVRNPQALAIGPLEAIEAPPIQQTITWDDETFPKKKQIKEDILRQFEEQWSEYEREMEAAGFIADRKRSLLPDHMRWIFMRVCLKQSWERIAKAEHAHMDTIRKSAYPIIEFLGLHQPKLRGGRPRK